MNTKDVEQQILIQNYPRLPPSYADKVLGKNSTFYLVAKCTKMFSAKADLQLLLLQLSSSILPSLLAICPKRVNSSFKQKISKAASDISSTIVHSAK